MDNHSDGFYEIEFQRIYRIQGRVLKRIRQLTKQLACYYNLMDELRAAGEYTGKLQQRINLTNLRLAHYNDKREMLEGAKEEISVNNPHNSRCAMDAKIIQAAYERAYQNQK